MKTLNKIIIFFYLILFFFTPLIFNFYNSELFELPKMYFVYSLTIIIVTLHLINWAKKNTPIFRKTILDIPLLLFLISQTISTFISIDITTSFFGYYSRLNGGLLSIISFALLYWLLAVYINKDFKRKIINTLLFSGLLVSLFGIAEHFGIDKHIWVQDVQSRVFSTLGQPNWLAAYLVMLLPISLSSLLKSKKKKNHFYFFFTTTTFYTCLLFTKSKSGIIASIISLILFFFFYLIKNKSKFKNTFKKIIPILSFFVLSSLLINNPIKEQFFPKTLPLEETVNNQTLNITSSENIRKIVWQGSFDLWKQYPFFGTGTESFAYSYYWTRPVSHNLTSEWEFLYNKAHNEYLNFLATTGAVGLISYLVLITFILIKTFPNKAIFTAILAFLITNIAGFSVVSTSLLFFTLPALTLLESKRKTKLKKTKKFLIPFFFIIFFFLLQRNINYFIADLYYSKAIKLDNTKDYQSAYNFINKSLSLRPKQSNYLTKSASLASKIAVITNNENPEYLNTAITNIDHALKKSPANISFWKEKAQIYYYLSSLDNQYFQSAINSLVQIQFLAPTDAKNIYTIAQFLESAQLTEQSIPYYQQAIELKENYDHAYFALGKIYFNQKEYKLAKENLNQALKYAPNNITAQEILNQINN